MSEKEILKECDKLFVTMANVHIDGKPMKDLLDLYNKEKEQNSLIKEKLEELNIPMETLINEFNRLEDLEDDREQLKWRLKEEKEKNEQAVIRLEYYIINNMALAKDEDRLNKELKKVLSALKGVNNE